MSEPARFDPVGDGALRAALPQDAPRRAVLAALRAIPGVRDAVLTERHACVHFDPLDPPATDALEAALRGPACADAAPPALHVVRARYDGADLLDVAARTGLSVDDVIALHSSREYVVELVGFLPGFAYLGALDERLRLPRRASPRPRVPASSIGIAGARTGVYPLASPGGWHLIATALSFRAFAPEHGATLALGDRVRFEPA